MRQRERVRERERKKAKEKRKEREKEGKSFAMSLCKANGRALINEEEAKSVSRLS